MDDKSKFRRTCLGQLDAVASKRDDLQAKCGIGHCARLRSRRSPRYCRIAIPGVACDSARLLQKLQASLASGDRLAACRMLQYPRPAGNLKDVADCVERFDIAFDAEVISATLAQRAENLFSNYEGYAVGAGELWFADCDSGCDLQIALTVNRNERLPFATNAEPAGTVKLACVTSDRRIEIASNGQGSVRLRSWLRSASPTARPDIEIDRAIEKSEGTGACAYDIWSFPQSDGRITIDGIGCYEASHAPPKNAIAHVLTQKSNQPDKSDYCFPQ